MDNILDCFVKMTKYVYNEQEYTVDCVEVVAFRRRVFHVFLRNTGNTTGVILSVQQYPEGESITFVVGFDVE